MTYTHKFALLQPWFDQIIEAVKRDLKQEHLQNDRQFLKTYFNNKPLQRITHEEFVDVYGRTIASGAENVGEFVAVRWLLKNSDLYGHFERELSQISPDFDQLEVLPEEAARALMKSAVAEYGATATYLFTVLNSVVFSSFMVEELRKTALEELAKKKGAAVEAEEKRSFDQLKIEHERVLQRLTDKYEKKLSGLQKKYIQDTEILKKQVSGLQRKLQPTV